MKEELLIYKLSETIKKTSQIDKELFTKYNVKRGLRNEDHTGVLVGLTRIGDVVGYERTEDGQLKAIPGKLYYRGIDVEELVHGIQSENRLGFEETAFLLLSGYLPTKDELETFKKILNEAMPLQHQATMNIMALKGHDIMNILARCVLEQYIYDEDPDNISRDNLIRQSINLVSKFPTIIAYAYNVLRHHEKGRSLHVRHPDENFSFAENFLFMIKGKGQYTPLEIKILDLALILHAEHGGGNNSTFSVRVTSSTETDTYSSIAAGIGSLKGPLHGGANLKVMGMIKEMRENINDWTDADEIDQYLKKLLNKEAYDKTGLIYGIGHAVYTISDPRAILLKDMARELAKEKGLEKEFAFQELIEQRAVEVFMNYKNGNNNKQVCVNVDFYSGFVYEAIGIPKEVYTPIFAMARIVGWCAHRIEELNFTSKRIIRPAYKNVNEIQQFIPLEKR
ncbi:MAG TPA: citrate/2-methylcitrate synthase [Paludibacteraceae bacterium]|jgi:citrate synthase|nr:citrate/2-methylcitrate synthase [Paludibacteraceae bacterium]HOL28785.1 citrate/2-methylcitrate synthase [Paludibacteraceae bacterium]HPD59335.1 citrate/2-methylcitrate synthase [Paludibacteraceae bacterium]HPQ12614.1 citrate/2-methylcitrate synthase [Paludibacteraceae bacterium]HQG66992.1 citrate/2-methylcitrate synthase [Paludibacteraceae bacterium]